MNAYCAYKPCGRIFHFDPRAGAANRRFCSKQCKGREGYRVFLERHGRPVSKKRPREILVCQFTGCGKPIAETRFRHARYCSDACAYRQRVIREREARNQAKAPAPTPPAPKSSPLPCPAPPIVAPVAYPKNPEALRCYGCKHVRIQPASWRGVECGNDVFRGCNPLGPAGPLLKEAI